MWNFFLILAILLPNVRHISSKYSRYYCRIFAKFLSNMCKFFSKYSQMFSKYSQNFSQILEKFLRNIRTRKSYEFMVMRIFPLCSPVFMIVWFYCETYFNFKLDLITGLNFAYNQIVLENFWWWKGFPKY